MSIMGFFDDDPRLAGQKETDQNKVGGKHPCERCGLHKKVITPRMPVTGEGKKVTWVHGEGPGAEEDRHGKQFHEKGAAGALLREKFGEYGWDLDRDCWKDNSVRCRPPNNRTPYDTEIKLCQTWIIPDISHYQPHKIAIFGGPAIKSLITTRYPSLKFDGVKKWVGWMIPDQQLKTWLFPNWHTSFLNRNRDDEALWLKFDEFFEKMINCDLSFPLYKNPADLIEIITNPQDATSLLTRLILEKRGGGLDWETTGLKPHMEGHRIVTGAIAPVHDLGEEERGYAFPIFYEDRMFMSRLRRWLRSPEIPKYGHNLRMEQSWSLNILKEEIRGMTWDSMEIAHLLDNRPKITGLKFQVYVNYGFVYGDEIQKFLRPTQADSDKYGANAINQIHKAPLKKLLLYNGQDAVFCKWLSRDQMMRVDPKFGEMKWVHSLVEDTIEGSKTFARMHEVGIPINEEYCENQMRFLERETEKVLDNIRSSKEVKKWTKQTGSSFNPRAHPQVKKLLNDVYDYGVKSVDKFDLQKVGIPLCNNIILLRYLDDLRNTYLGGWYREAVGGVMRPFFPTHLVATYRGSSDNPNFTNIPRRDKKAKRITRTAILPRSGRKILDVDYKGIEVCIGACNSKDPQLIKYVTDPSTNMHRDQATKIYLLEPERITKPLYDAGKSGFVFPQFYGSYWGNCAPDLWDRARGEKLQDGTPVLEHLRDQGIKSYQMFEGHIQDVEDEFWNVKFRVYKDWKDSMWKFYQRYGYIELLTGHRCYWTPKGLLGRKECMNYPNQGTAFLCLRWSMIQLDKLINEERGWSSRMMGQIHDDLVWDLEPSELTDLWKISEQVMCREIRDHWPWIIVPLAIEGEMTKTLEEGGNWNEQEEVKL